MKIKFLDSVAGANFAYRRNQVVDLRVDVAKEFIRAKQAIVVVDDVPAAQQTATAAAPEVAAQRAGGRRRNLRNLGGLLPQ